MARSRTIKPDFFASDQVAAVAFEWRLLFIGLWTIADREGRLLDRPARIKATLFPYDDLDVGAGLEALLRAELITRYDVAGMAVIGIPTWRKHQQPHVKEAASTLPAPGSHGASRSDPDPDPDPDPRSCAEPGPLAAGSATFLDFPVVGSAGTSWALTEALVAEFQELYPTVDVRQESRAALGWVRATPGRRKTGGGMRKFLNNWLTKAVNDYRGGRGTTIPAAKVQPGALPEYRGWSCPHVDRCDNRQKCQIATNLRRPVKAAS